MGSCCGPENRVKYFSKQVIKIDALQISKDELVGVGGYGQIWKCKNIITRQLYALKQIKLQTKQLNAMLEKQVHFLTKLKNCQHVVHMVSQTITKTKQYNCGLILMELGQMTLLDHIKNHKSTDDQIVQVMFQISQAILQMQQKGICHLDIKPQNILIFNNRTTNTPIYKLCDFGSAMPSPIKLKNISKGDKTSIQQYLQSNSTLIYRSPQMIDIDLATQINHQSDLWMLGCVIYLMIYRKHPFQHDGKLGILSCNLDFPNVTSNQNIIIALKGILVRDPTQRYTAQKVRDILCH